MQQYCNEMYFESVFCAVFEICKFGHICSILYIIFKVLCSTQGTNPLAYNTKPLIDNSGILIFALFFSNSYILFKTVLVYFYLLNVFVIHILLRYLGNNEHALMSISISEAFFNNNYKLEWQILPCAYVLDPEGWDAALFQALGLLGQFQFTLHSRPTLKELIATVPFCGSYQKFSKKA